MDPAEIRVQAMISRQQVIHSATAPGNSDIQLFYLNETVFITGGLGFLGKQLIEKLFRSCKIKKIFLLIRTKNGKEPAQRLTKTLKDPVFDYLYKNQPEFTNRIVIIQGNVALPRLGVSDENWKILSEEVTVIFHGAATLRFDEPLQTATITNVRGTREMLQLGHACKNLKSFVYISTAFSHATSSRIGTEVLEQFYPVPIPPDTIVDLAENMGVEKLDQIAAVLMDVWPNTYCFTKALAEELVRTQGSGLPVCVVRPAIVSGAYSEVLPGWIDCENLYGANGMLLGFIMGIIHVPFAKSKGQMDFVPVDIVNNAVISAGRETGRRWEQGQNDIKIYTLTGERNFLSTEECTHILHTDFRKLMSPKAIWYMYIFIAENVVVYNLLSLLLQDIPARVVDCVSYLLGKKPRLVPVYKKVYKTMTVLKYFVNNDWIFSDRNLLEMYRNMDENDKFIFNFNITKICKKDMIILWALGLRKYVIRDKLRGTSIGIRKQILYKNVSYVVFLIYILFLWVILWLLFHSLVRLFFVLFHEK